MVLKIREKVLPDNTFCNKEIKKIEKILALTIDEC